MGYGYLNVVKPISLHVDMQLRVYEKSELSSRASGGVLLFYGYMLGSTRWQHPKVFENCVMPMTHRWLALTNHRLRFLRFRQEPEQQAKGYHPRGAYQFRTLLRSPLNNNPRLHSSVIVHIAVNPV